MNTPLPNDGQTRKDLQNLLRFTAELLGTRDKVVFDIAEYPIHLTERDFRDSSGAPLPGIAFGPAEDTWLAFDRLRERKPPQPDIELAPWLRADSRPSPARAPELVVERVVEVTAEEVSDLVEAGLAGMEEVARVEVEPGEPEVWVVPLRPAELPDVTAALARYIAGPWQAWAAEEVPRRRAIALYEALFKAHAQIAAAAGEGAQELVIGIGLARWAMPPHSVNVPLIEQRAEFELDEANGRLSIVPRNTPPTAVLRPFQEMSIPDATALQREMTARLDQIMRDPDVVFAPSQRSSFLSVLETCAARLDASGVVLAADEESGPATDSLRVSPTLCVIVRARRADIIRDDIEHLWRRVADPDIVLPEPGRRFVIEPPDEVEGGTKGIRLPGTGAPGDGWDGPPTPEGHEPKNSAREWLFFPLPANEEQEEIARRLEQANVHGVVVQGPPGTGKTHTIANIIGHCMAMGQRVLVAAHTAEALSAIRDKLPPQLRDLAIAVTHSDREGARQLEEAVTALADRVQTINPAEVQRQAEDHLRAIVSEDARVRQIDLELRAIAGANLTEVEWRGAKVLPQAIAVWRAAQQDRHAWFSDRLDLVPANDPCFSAAEIDEARALRRKLGQNITYHADRLPPGAAGLPSVGAVVHAHQQFRAQQAREMQEISGALLRPEFDAAAPGEAADLLDWLEQLAEWRDECGEHGWMHGAWEALAVNRSMGRLAADILRTLLGEAVQLAVRGDALTIQAIELPEIDEPERLGEALSRLSDGRSAFALLDRRGRKAAQEALDAARLAAALPRTPEDWGRIAELHAWRGEFPGFVARWNALAGQHRLTLLPNERVAARDAAIQLGRTAERMLTLVAQVNVRIERLKVLFPFGLEVETAVLRLSFQGEMARAIDALRATQGDARHRDAQQVRDKLRAAGKETGGPLGEALGEIAESLGQPDRAEPLLAEQWRTVQAEVDRLAALRDDLRRLRELAARVRQSGATRWAERINSEPAGEEDEVLPPTWRDAWDLARATGFLARIANREQVQELTAIRARLLAQREHRFLETIVLMTHLGLRNRLSPNVQAALRQFLAALARMPKTAGAKTAVRQRRILRDSLERAAKAIPCWIMPEWRVAEQLPPELGSFDLVIIDEASQSNILALPVVLRGRKVLIVGDDRQVSPSPIGIDDAAVTRLRNTYLRGQPLANQMDLATSLYELAGMMYPERVVMLCEHFRCVEPIIRFSSRFYNNHLRPLRLPKSSERIDPPLVDILVAHGRRRGDVNDAEADVIVQEIQAAIGDPKLNAAGRRSIGVISLHADKQAKLIYDRLIDVVGPETMSAHRISCGDAATFQGQERDIVFLSMVHDRTTAAKQSTRLYEQRYNVALSRARDRMVLVRSVTASDLKEGDIKLAVLRHFQDPMGGGRVVQNADVLVPCQSEFERDFGRRLLAAGYRLRAQVPAGGYSIDFVVEGGEDRRLAIELDGDSFHGPDRWAADVARQKALERIGWVFWRCWASEWEADKDGTFGDLVRTLTRHGITAIGADTGPAFALVEFRRVGGDAPVEPAAPVETDVPPDAGGAVPATAEPPSSVSTVVLAAHVTVEPPPATTPAPAVQSREVTEPVNEKRHAGGMKVRVGHTVRVRFADGQARTLTLRLVPEGQADGRTRIGPKSPLAEAILGLRAEDETEVIIDGKRREIVVEEIMDEPLVA